MMTVVRPGHLTPIDLDLRSLAALSREQISAQDQHLDACPACAGTRAGHDHVLETLRGAPLEPGLRQLLAKRRGRRPLARLWPVLLLPVLGVVALMLVGPRSDLDTKGVAPVIGVKGAPNVRVFARRGDRVFAVGGEALAPGDAVRLLFDPPGRPFVLVVSTDGAGKANVYFPYRGQASASVDPRAVLEIPGSLVLDDTAGPERVFALFSDRPLMVSEVETGLHAIGARGWDAIRDTSTLPLPQGVAQTSFLLERRPR
jgi:hypothetical protein